MNILHSTRPSITQFDQHIIDIMKRANGNRKTTIYLICIHYCNEWHVSSLPAQQLRETSQGLISLQLDAI